MLGLGLESVGVEQEVGCLMNVLIIDNSRLLYSSKVYIPE